METFHCFTRGVNKQRIFEDDWDYARFMILLLVCNSTEAVHMGNLLNNYKGRTSLIFEKEVPDKRLVDILAYTLMPNHIHIVLQEIGIGGISKFMQKLFTAHAMYFNKKYDHSGTLFESKFKAKLVDNEAYFRWIFSYTHLNQVALVEPKWEEKGIISDPDTVRKFMNGYRWSSYYDYMVADRPESAILSMGKSPDFLREVNDLEEMLSVYTGGNGGKI